MVVSPAVPKSGRSAQKTVRAGCLAREGQFTTERRASTCYLRTPVTESPRESGYGQAKMVTAREFARSDRQGLARMHDDFQTGTRTRHRRSLGLCGHVWPPALTRTEADRYSMAVSNLMRIAPPGLALGTLLLLATYHNSTPAAGMNSTRQLRSSPNANLVVRHIIIFG